MIWRGQLGERKRVVAAMASQGKCRAEISARLTNGHEQRENAEQNPVNVESVAEPRMDPGKAWVFKHEKAECDSEKTSDAMSTCANSFRSNLDRMDPG